MLKNEILNIYDKCRLHFYMQVFSRFENREATLTTVESFSMECIMALDHPTIAEFANMMNISSPNAAYRVNSLVQKGYVKKVRSKEDARIYFLEPTKKYLSYYRINASYVDTVVERCKERFSEEDFNQFTEYLHIVNSELMPELDLSRFKRER
ncbi:MAG: MarR family winged helix-turn-helix transcriptional regulator [Lachnospiraceae bacterium]|nr:MarR family winged helix-turn-helix transcriptional regulator [Lachnospiraceae bacterium]